MADSLGIEQEALERLASVDPMQLQGEDLISYEAFKRQRELNVYGYRYPSELLAIDQFDNWATVFAQLASGTGAHLFRTAQDYDEFLARMDGFVAWSEQVINNLRAGISKGVVLPKVVVERTLPQIEALANVEDPRQTIFWRPLLNFPAGLSVEDRKRLRVTYDEKLRTRVIPEYRRLHDYLSKEYLPHARDTIAWSALPSGDYWYAVARAPLHDDRPDARAGARTGAARSRALAGRSLQPATGARAGRRCARDVRRDASRSEVSICRRRGVARWIRSPAKSRRCEHARAVPACTQGDVRDPRGRALPRSLRRERVVSALERRRHATRRFLRQHVGTRGTTDVPDGCDLPARGGAGAPLPGCARAGDTEPAELSTLRLGHCVR